MNLTSIGLFILSFLFGSLNGHKCTVDGTKFNVRSNYSTFDSYQHLSELETFPNVCDDYEKESCAIKWIETVNVILSRDTNRVNNVEYAYSVDINEETEKIMNEFDQRAVIILKNANAKSRKFQWKRFASCELRKIFETLTATADSSNTTILNEIVVLSNKISNIYNKARPCFRGKCLDAGEYGIVDLFINEKDYDTLTGYWISWQKETGNKLKNFYMRRTDLQNIGARENGHHDYATFDLEQDYKQNDFPSVVLRLYEDILPLFKELHGYVRHCLGTFYQGKFDRTGPMPVHIFGNVWGQEWTNIFPLIQKCRNRTGSEYLNEADRNLQKHSVKEMFKMAEDFYTSIGMYKMTDAFWERSVLEKLPNKTSDCHGSASDFSNNFDFRIKMCTNKIFDDFQTIHHEMGHIQYFMAYRELSLYFRNSANSGFHEAIGDTITLSVNTPKHLQKIGLISKAPTDYDSNIDFLLSMALSKISFLPFALTMDLFLWNVYNGSVPVDEMNEFWWELRYKYQGVKPPVPRSKDDFDAGSKYHIALGISYIRYFASFIYQFQFYEAMCKLSKHEGPLHQCDFSGSKEAGRKLLEMLSKGSSQPWPETLEILTGEKKIMANSILEYFAPLHRWLKHTNKLLGIPVGW